MASTSSIKAGSAYVELLLRDSTFSKGLKSASKKLTAFGEAISGLGTKLAAMGSAITVPLVGFAKLFASGAKELSNMSQRTGVSVEALSELGYAAQLTGVDAESLEKGLRLMQRTIVKAAQGSKSATEALAMLGVSVEDLRGLSPDEQFALLAQKLSQIQSPAVRAATAMQLLGRSGTQLLPLLNRGAAGIAAMRQEARDLGLTASSTGVAVGVRLEDALQTLWRVLKKLWTTLGAAIAPLLTQWAQSLTDIIVRTTAWVKENQDLVAKVFTVAKMVTYAGLALVGLGKAFTVISSVVAGVGTALAAVGSGIAMLGSILAWLLTPVGLVVAAVAALGAYLVYASGVGGEALTWLGDRFTELKDFATAAFGGIADALLAGDVALAAQILWLSLKIAWQKGIGVLQSAWLSFKGWFLKVAYGAFYGAQAAWEIVQHGLTVAWIETTAFLASTWTRFSSTVMSVWETTQNWLAKRWIELMGMFDEKLDTNAAKALLDKGSAEAQRQIEQEKLQRLAEHEQQRAGTREGELRLHERNLAEIGQAYNDEAAALDAEKASKIAQSEAELARLRREWEAAIAEAHRKRQEKDAQGPKHLGAAPALADDLEGIAPVIEKKAATIGVAGTFNAMEARGLGAGGVTDRIAKASEQTARNTKKILDEVEDWDGLAFD